MTILTQLTRFFLASSRKPDEQDLLMSMLSVAQEDPQVRMQLLAMLSEVPGKRQARLQRWLDELREQDAPDNFISALAILMDENTASAALKLLEDDPHG